MALEENDPALLETLAVFEEEGYEYILRLGASMVWVTNKAGRRYCYYPTTGRWAPFGTSRPKTHYRSRSVRDFVDRFLSKEDRLQVKVDERLIETLPEELKRADLMELLTFIYEEFEDGQRVCDVYYNLRREYRKDLIKEP